MYRGRSKERPKSIIETSVLAPKLIHINVGINGELWGRLNDARVKFGMTKASIVEEALEKWLEGRSNPDLHGVKYNNQAYTG